MSISNLNQTQPAFQARLVNYESIRKSLEGSLKLTAKEKSVRLKKLDEMKNLIDLAGDSGTDIKIELQKLAAPYEYVPKAHYLIEITNKKFPELKYTEKLEFLRNKMDENQLNEKVLDMITDECVSKTSEIAQFFTNITLQKFESKLLADISLAAGKLPLEVLKIFGIKSAYWEEIADTASRLKFQTSASELFLKQKNFKKVYSKFLNNNNINFLKPGIRTYNSDTL